MNVPPELATLLSRRRKSTGRKRYQRPEVKAHIGQSGRKYWRAEWREYREGAKPRHRVETWLASEYSKQQAQEQCDKLVRRETQEVRPDGSMLLKDYWERAYWPVKREHLSVNTQGNYTSAWKLHLAPLHDLPLAEITRHDVDSAIVAAAKKGYAENTCSQALGLIRTILGDAHQDGLIQRNPARDVKVPPSAKPERKTRSLSEDEAKRLLSVLGPAERPLWAVLSLCGLRISEVYGLLDTDLLPGRWLLVERQSHATGYIQPKSRKTRKVPIPARLWADLQELAKRHPNGPLFPAPDGSVQCRNYQSSRDAMLAVRTAAGIPDLTYRMCRTTFATLYQGDIADASATLGHATAEFTAEVYRRPIAERQQREADRLEDRLTPRLRRVK